MPLHRQPAGVFLVIMKKPLLLVAFIAAPVLLAGEPVTVTPANVRTFYAGFTKLTKDPHQISNNRKFSVLCRPAPNAADLENEKKRLGPHYATAVHYYANPEAAQAMQQSARELPEGSIIVKEKLGVPVQEKLGAPAKAGDANPVLEIGGMIKRAKGTNPASGDWEFFFSGVDGKFTSGAQLANCAECHNAAVNDHIYAAWRFALMK